LEFAQRIARLVNLPGRISFEEGRRGSGDPQRRQPDISRAKTVLGWSPKIALDEGLSRTFEYFKAQLT
jgi:dTDP-glucose 4,6-dehydratase